MHITIGAPVPGAAWLLRPGDDVPAPPQGALPAGQLMNQKVAMIGDSRMIESAGFKRYVAGGASRLYSRGDYAAFAQGGYTGKRLNNVSGSDIDYVGQALESDFGVFVVLVGYNDLGAAAEDADMVTNRMNAVKVAVTGESGVFARDPSGQYYGWGDACADGAGGTGVVTHVAGGFAWIAQPSGLAAGDVITCVNSGWSATLAEDPPAHSGRALFWVSEIPASLFPDPAIGGPQHQAFHDYLESGPYDDSAHIHVRTVNAMESMADTPNPPEYPFPYRANESYDGIHCRYEACLVGSAGIGEQIDAVLANYDRQDATFGAAPAGVTDLGADLAFDGSQAAANGTLPAGFSQFGGAAPISLVGDDGDPDREFRVTIDEPVSAGYGLGHALRIPLSWTPQAADVYLRFGVELRLTNTAGDGPPVGVGPSVSHQLLVWYPGGGYKLNQLLIDDVFVDQWARVMVHDIFIPAGQTGTLNVDLYSTYQQNVPVDALFRWRRPGLWMIPA